MTKRREHFASAKKVKETAKLDAMKSRGFDPQRFPAGGELYRETYKYWIGVKLTTSMHNKYHKHLGRGKLKHK